MSKVKKVIQVAESDKVRSKYVDHPLQAFVDVRQRPAVFLFLSELRIEHVLHLQRAIGTKKFDDLDLVIHSGGGDIHAAYQIIEFLRRHTRTLNACVPLYAKSAATLLCLGADTIVLDELAQLGPLDTQIAEEPKPGETKFTSALNPFKALEQLLEYSLKTLGNSVLRIEELYSKWLSPNDFLTHAIQFVGVTTGPLIARLDTEKFGDYSRALAVGYEYGDRLLRRFTKWDDNKRRSVLLRLVYSYPSHDYVIDYDELVELEFLTKLFDPKEQDAVRGLLDYILQRLDQQIPNIDVIECISESSEGSREQEMVPTKLSNREEAFVTAKEDGQEQFA